MSRARVCTVEPAFTTSSSLTRYHRHAETTFGRIADPVEASRRWLPSSRPPRGVEIKTKPHAVVTPPLAHSSSTHSTRSTVRWLRKGFSHTFFASATLKSFQRTLALSRSIEVSRLIVAGTAAQSSRVSARLLPLLLPERVASSSSELRQLVIFAREPSCSVRMDCFSSRGGATGTARFTGRCLCPLMSASASIERLP